ncbi:MAG: bifunctional (p)ppGpp synthetase/guanosine-3',5'-bis(diphosphate) 3'-pyrophosphohydrolase, partial [Clostridia bacterium]|nr:bifunctional (p)ppGpp synthetase/guanosine-3',5'-bis(diphosphate) 3'-pyrophosphohydrolase [Clostridia bacterium]
CNPLPGDSIVGFITKGYGVSVHKHNCRNILSGMKDPSFRDRLVNVRWDEAVASDHSKGLYEATFRVFAENTISILADVTTTLADMKVTLVAVNTKKRTEDDIVITLTVGCRNSDHYESIVSRLRSVPHVRAVTGGSD